MRRARGTTIRPGDTRLLRARHGRTPVGGMLSCRDAQTSRWMNATSSSRRNIPAVQVWKASRSRSADHRASSVVKCGSSRASPERPGVRAGISGDVLGSKPTGSARAAAARTSRSSTSSRRRRPAAAISSCGRSSRELERRGLDVELNRLSAATPACLFNSFNFDAGRLRRFARSDCRMVHRVDGPIGVVPGVRRRHRPLDRRD